MNTLSKLKTADVLFSGSDWNRVAELDSERIEELIDQFNDAFNKTEYNEVPLTRRLAPFHG